MVFIRFAPHKITGAFRTSHTSPPHITPLKLYIKKAVVNELCNKLGVKRSTTFKRGGMYVGRNVGHSA